ncbi:MAG: hypothetical protein F9K44_00560 [Hyphomicrobiaceae bacterium]|nr:MAG: hypothetical protein F9K44_00560 [Hyphomicrobiaceae bacterium]
MVWHKVLFLWGNLLVSFIFGAVALGVLALFFPEWFDGLYEWAGGVKRWVTGLGIPTRYNIFLKVLIHESSIMLATAVLVTRMLTSLIYALFTSYVWPGRRDVTV